MGRVEPEAEVDGGGEHVALHADRHVQRARSLDRLLGGGRGDHEYILRSASNLFRAKSKQVVGF